MDNDRLTPFADAISRKRDAVAEVLRQHGGH
jgi:hypothetical protein